MLIFYWKNTETFRRHTEEMGTFRRSHELLTPIALASRAEKAYTPLSGDPPSTMPAVNGFNWENSKKTVVLIWYITMPRDSQN